MRIRAGYDIAFTMSQHTPMILMLTVHPSRAKDLLTEQKLMAAPKIPLRDYRDTFGNVCTRVMAPPGSVEFKANFEVHDSGQPDEVVPHARQHPIEELPDEALVFLLGSRYCVTQSLLDFAWREFGNLNPGKARVQAICDFVHNHIKFGYSYARDDRMASDAYRERVGVCRDFAHLAVTLCRCMNIPARYCTGYLGDIGVPPDTAPMDFSAWFDKLRRGKINALQSGH
jgi:transglutaminase-like putative cysteine protease